MRKGFTLIELILYVSIITIVMSALIPFAWNVIEGGAKSSVEQDVSSQARFISQRIMYEIRNASDINSVSASSISLKVANASLDPTIIDLFGGNIRIKQGPGQADILNSTDTTITSLTFTDYSSADLKAKNIQFTFTIDDNYTGARQEFNAPPETLESAAEIRSN